MSQATILLAFLLGVTIAKVPKNTCGDGDPKPDHSLIINSSDTVIFDLSQLTCTGSYIDVPLSILSNDTVYAIDFSMQYDNSKITYNTLFDRKPYLGSAAYYNPSDSTLRFTTFSIQPIENNSTLVSIRFNLPSGQLNASYFNNIITYLNGDQCSYKIINNPLSSSTIIASGPTTFNTGDSVSLSATAGAGYTYLWSTGETTQTVNVKTAATYSVTITTGGGCAVVSAINVIVITPLPVTLVDFSVQQNDEEMLLAWTTASEINNDYFSVERSADATNWEEIKRINGAGNSTTLINYSVIDGDPLEGINYYQLKQTDYDGTSTYSQIKMNYFSNTNHRTSVGSVFPNPAVAGVVTVSSSENATVQLMDVQGAQVILQTEAMANKKQEVNIANVANGVYLVKIFNDRFVSVKKLVINK